MAEAKLRRWKTTRSHYVVKDRWLRLRADTCVTPTGDTIAPFYVLEYRDWVNCLPIDAENNAILVRHYRHGVQEYLPEVVSGGVEESDASPADAMRRELTEEIGYVDGELHELGISYPNPANQTNKVYSFVALGGVCEAAPEREPGETLEVVRLPLDDVLRTLRHPSSEVVFQSMHLLTILLAASFLGYSDAVSD